MKTDSQSFKEELQGLGISKEALEAVWPKWWSNEADGSISAQAEMRFSVARRLGLTPKSVIGEDQPEFVWRHDAKFKGLSAYGGDEEAALTSFGIAFGRHLEKGISRASRQSADLSDATSVRQAILGRSPYVSLPDVCAVCWGFGIPVVHLRVFPLSAKNMVAMAVRTLEGFAILVGKDSRFPAPTAFHVAHELGHIAAGHLAEVSALVDLEETIEKDEKDEKDEEEGEADGYALELLTGQRNPSLQFDTPPRNGLELAQAVAKAASERRIEPGTLALCYGYQTNDWKTAYAALHHIYDSKHDVWRFLNLTASKQLDWSSYRDDEAAYIRAVMGAVDVA
ncbi:hypothetical protein [Roseobacter weihaiensis]|uniref:hypothetical protein n=1 Tax=Roseobacter weihaiensis TaxID=2763262 RepID=UPI001D0AB36D|nr:hypothetical protein [Roseobacter sp. H9]